ncbi:hypothetical protein JW921_05010 [Candidatus Fermentibacterales bacterium]|nr:hypothetical protein [Candidatus Fermentibacterales bacterium]
MTGRAGRGFAAAVLVFLIATFLVYDRSILARGLPGGPMSDTEHQGYPFLGLASTMISQGQFPHWNPMVFCGTPFYSSFSVPLFYFPRGLLLLLGGVEAFARLSFPLHMLLGGVFAYLFLRRIGLGVHGSLFGGFAFCSGAWANTLFYAGHGSKVVCWSYLPLLLYAVEGWLSPGAEPDAQRPGALERARFLAIGGLALGAQALASHPQVMMYSFGAAIAWGACRSLVGRAAGRLRSLSSAAVGLAVILALGIGTGAVQLLPGMHFSASSTRGEGLDLSTSASYSLPPEESLTMVLPHLFGYRHGFPDSAISGVPLYWGRLGLRLSSEFLGLSVFLLAIAGSLSGRRRLSLPMLLVGLAGLLIAWGGYTPIYGLLYRIVPFFRKLRAPHIAMLLPSSVLPLLAGVGLDSVLQQSDAALKRSRLLLRIVAGLSALLLLAGLLAGPIVSSAQQGWWERMGAAGSQVGAVVRARVDMARTDLYRAALVGLAVVFLLLIPRARFRGWRTALLAGLLLVAGWELIPLDRDFQYYLPYDTVEEAYGGSRAPSGADGVTRVYPGENRLMLHGVASVVGYHAAKLEVTDEMLAALQTARDDISAVLLIRQTAADYFQADNRLVPYGEVREMILSQVAASADSASRAADSAMVASAIPPGPLPRFFLAASWSVCDIPDMRTAMAQGLDPLGHTLLETEPAGLPDSTGSGGSIELISDEPARIVLRVTRDRPGLLVVADTWYDRWRASVDGAPTPVLRANHWQRALALPACPDGAVVEMWYDGSLVTGGLLITLLTMLASGLLVLLSLLRSRKGTRAALTGAEDPR